MKYLRNSLEVAVYCAAHNEGKAGFPNRASEFAGRDKVIFEAGHEDGKAAALRASFLRADVEGRNSFMYMVTPRRRRAD